MAEIAVSIVDGSEAFLSFEVMNCTLNSIKMECINWVASSTYDSDNTNTKYNRWGEGSPAKFYWFDPAMTLTADDEVTTKWATNSLTMAIEADLASSLAFSATALLLTSALVY